MSSEIMVGVYQLSRYDEKIPLVMADLLENLEPDLKDLGVKGVRWYLEEEELSLVIILQGRGLQEAFRVLEEGLVKAFADSGVSVKPLLKSSADELSPSRRSLIALTAIRVQFEWLERLLREALRGGEGFWESLKNRFEGSREGGLSSFLIPTAVLSLRGNIEKFLEEHGNFLRESPRGSLPFIVYLRRYGTVKLSTFYERVFPVLVPEGLDPVSFVNSLAESLKVCKVENERLKLTSLGFTVAEGIENLLGKILDRALRLKGELEEIFEQKSKRIGYVIRRGGEVVTFSLAEALESLLEAGLTLEESLRIIELLPDMLISDVVSSIEIAAIMESLMSRRDASGRSAAAYMLLLGTRDYLFVKGEDESYPFSRNYIRSKASKLLEGKVFQPMSSVIGDVVDAVYSALRRIYLVSAPWIVLQGSRRAIGVSEKLIDAMIVEAFEKTSPYAKKLMQVEQESIGDFIKGFLMQELLKVEEFLIEARERLELGLEPDEETVFLRLYELSGLLLILFRTFPAPSLTTNATFVSLRVKDVRRGLLTPLVPLENKTLNRMLFLSKRLLKARGLYAPKLDHQMVSLCLNIIEDLKNSLSNM